MQNCEAVRREYLYGAVEIVERSSGWTAVRIQQKRNFLARFIADGFCQQPFDFSAILAFPLHDFRVGERIIMQPGVVISQLLERPKIGS